MGKSKDELLAEVTNIFGENLLKKDKKAQSLIIEKFDLDTNLSNVLKGLIKDRLHLSYENTIQEISKMSDNKESYFGYLFKLEQESKRKF